MARARTLKPSFFKNEVLAECQPLARILFEGLWCEADREGRLEDRPKRLKAEILPYDDCDVSSLLSELENHGFIARYSVGEDKYIQILTFKKHQTPHPKEAASSIPEMESRVIKRQAAEIPGQASEMPERAEPSILLSHSFTEAKASSADAPIDPKSEIFGEQLSWLKSRTKRGEPQLRSWLGKCCKEFGDHETLAALIETRAQSPPAVEPLSRMKSLLQRKFTNGKFRKNHTPTEGLYGGFAIAIARAEQRDQSSSDCGTDIDPSQPLLDSK